MKTILRLTVTAAVFALSCQASETPSQIEQEGLRQSYTHSNGVTYEARLYDGSPKKITFTKTTLDAIEQIDCGYAPFQISYLAGVNGILKPVPDFLDMRFQADSEEELMLLKNLATRLVTSNACYFRPPYIAPVPRNVIRIIEY